MFQRSALRSSGGWLALVAVAMQLLLSYGHVHRDLRGGEPTGGVLALFHKDGGSLPQRFPTGDAADKACEICAVMALAGSLVLPEPALLPVPAFSGVAVESTERVFALHTAPYVLYRTRAPPIV